MCPLSIETRRKILDLVPWQVSACYTTMLRVNVKSKAKGALHVSSIHFGPKGFHGGGMYVTDAIVWLQQFDGHSSLELLGRLAVAPALAPGSTFLPGTDEHSLSAFGFGADGAMVNGTYLFALVALVLFAVEQGTTAPPLLVTFLQAIPVQQKRADSTSARMVESMVTSAVQSTLNRSMDDPLLLAAEFARQVPTCVPMASGMNAIRVVVKLYKARTSMTPQLRLHKHTEDATLRLMDRTKFAEGSISILSRMVCKAGWKSGPMSQDNVLAPAFAIGACLVESSNRTWSGFAVQTADGASHCTDLVGSTVGRGAGRWLHDHPPLKRWDPKKCDRSWPLAATHRPVVATFSASP